MAINKVVYGNNTLMDLTNDTVEANNLLEGATAHDRSGQQVQGAAKQGHTIKNDEGTSLIQRNTMQFKGTLRATDDPTNQQTVIDDSAVEISWEDWQDMTEQEREAYLAEHPKVDVVGFPDADADLQLDFMTKLWENPNTTQAFAPQTITLNSADYDFLLCVARRNTSYNQCVSTIVEKGMTVMFSLSMTTGNGVQTILRRLDYVSDTSYSAQASTIQTGTSTSTTDNANMIPVAIYGIKKKITVTVDAIAEDVSTLASKCIMPDGETTVAQTINKITESKYQHSENVASDFTATRNGYLYVMTYLTMTSQQHSGNAYVRINELDVYNHSVNMPTISAGTIYRDALIPIYVGDNIKFIQTNMVWYARKIYY